MGSFEEVMLPHLPTAYNLARWLLRNDHDAEDAVQEAYLKALRAFDRFRGGDGRAWLLAIVRNGCYSRLRQQRRVEPHDAFDESVHGAADTRGEEAERERAAADAAALAGAVGRLPEGMREMILLRDFEGLSYREIAEVAEVPVGTVMSRLARARERLQRVLAPGREGGSL